MLQLNINDDDEMDTSTTTVFVQPNQMTSLVE